MALDRRLARALRSFRQAPLPSRAHAALLVVDMQAYFAGICEPILDTARIATEACRDRGIPVLFTQHGHADPDADGGMLAEWWDELIIEGTEQHQLLPRCGWRPGDTVIPKRRYSAFWSTDLEQRLRERGVQDLAVAGVMTNLCVETTVRDAFIRDFRVWVLADATATLSEEMQIASLLNMAFGCAHVQTVAQWIAALDAKAE